MIALAGPILPIDRNETIDRRDIPLPVCWVRRGAVSDSPVDAAPFVSLGNGGAERLERDLVRGDAVAFLLGAEPPGVAIDALLAAADRGARVYVLASPGFAEGRRDPGLRDRRRAHVLVRRIEGLPVSGVIVGRGARAGIWLGPTPDIAPGRWWSLSSAQGDALFRVFLHLFWHHAADEALTQGGPLTFRKIEERPFDAPSPRSSAPVRLFLGDAPPLDGAPGDLLYLPGNAAPSDARPVTVFTPPRGDGQEPLASLARAGTRVVWDDLELPAFRVGAAGGVIEAASGAMRIRVALEEAQVTGLRRAAEQAAQRAAFQLSVDVRLGAIEGEVWLPGQAKPAPLVRSVSIDAPATPADTLRGMASTPARTLPDAPTLALSVEYRWKVLPPRAPAGAAADPLLIAWREFDEEARKRIGAVRGRLVELERTEGTLSRAFAALAGALLGFGLERGELLKELTALEAEPPSLAGPERARGLFDRLAKVEEEANRLESSVAEEERREHEKQEREKQEREWRSQRAAAEQALEKARKELSRRKEEEEKVEAEFGELASSSGDDPEDRKARRKHLWDEAKSLGKQIRQLESDVERHEKAAQETFEYRPTRTAGARDEKGAADKARFVPRTPARPADKSFPREAPPKVGELLRGKDGRYLVITRWEELDEGEHEAERLGARLVAPAEVT